jgi:hypothetical protein
MLRPIRVAGRIVMHSLHYGSKEMKKFSMTAAAIALLFIGSYVP